jgi:hypothetical protein
MTTKQSGTNTCWLPQWVLSGDICLRTLQVTIILACSNLSKVFLSNSGGDPNSIYTVWPAISVPSVWSYAVQGLSVVISSQQDCQVPSKTLKTAQEKCFGVREFCHHTHLTGARLKVQSLGEIIQLQT